MIRYRRRDDSLPAQTRYNVPVEVLYTAVPILIVAVLFVFTVVTQNRVARASGTPDLTVEVTGFQWGWRFHYPADDVTVVGTGEDEPELVLPVGQRVRFVLVSSDVIHSFYVPRFLVKRDTVPGIRNTMDVDVVRPGRYRGHCAEFCGLRHDRMDFDVVAVAPGTFDEWMARQRRGAP